MRAWTTCILALALAGLAQGVRAHAGHSSITTKGARLDAQGRLHLDPQARKAVGLELVDVEFGVIVPRLPWLRVFAGGYWLDNETRESKYGVSGRIEANLTDAATIQLSISDDPIFGTNVAFAVSYAIGPNWQPLRPYRKRTMHQRLYQQVA